MPCGEVTRITSVRSQSKACSAGRELELLSGAQAALMSARGRSERAFATHQGRLPKELALAGITRDTPDPQGGQIDRGRLEEFGRAAALRSAQLLPPVQSAYNPDGRPRSAADFDEKSLPFGVASLSFSQAVNDIARVWSVIWRRAGGDEGEHSARPAKRKTHGSPPASTGIPERP